MICKMYASLPVFLKSHTIRRHFAALILVILAVSLASCGDDVAQETSQTPTNATSDPPHTANVKPTSTPAPTATIAPTPTATAEPTPAPPYWTQIEVRDAADQYPPLNEFTNYELRNTQEWLNGDPTTIKELQEAGKIILVDFWTYT